MVKQPVKVIVRTRPTSKFATQNLKLNGNHVDLDLASGNEKFLNNRRQSYGFKFSKVLHNASQEEVFNQVCYDSVLNTMGGYNSTVFCYGQTGSGKTYTISGPSTDYQQRGLIPRAIEKVFKEINNRPERSFSVKVSYLEIYNEQCMDLLDLNNEQELHIMENSNGQIFVRNLTHEDVQNEEEAMSLMFEGETNRQICEHKLNKASSRSHCVFTIHIESRSRVESDGKTIFSKLNLVDLAGSERVGKTHSSGQVLEEAKYINKSLTFLEQVVIALSNPNRDHVPYRQSKLTNALKDSIGGNSITSMIANIWGEAEHLEETLSTLRFASRVMRISNDAIINYHLNPEALIKQYQKQISELKQELAMHDQLKGVNQVNYDEYTEEQKIELREQIQRYLDGDLEELPIKNLRQIKETYAQFKVVFSNRTQTGNRSPVSKQDYYGDKQPQKDQSDVKGVGEQNEKDGFSVGKAAPSNQFKAKKIPKQKAASGQDDGATTESKDETANDQQEDPTDKDAAYEKFKLKEGKETFDILQENLNQQKEKKSQYKQLGKAINECKRKIDEIKNKIENKKLLASDPNVVDQEEQTLYNELSEAKSFYRSQYDERKQTKNEIDYINNLIIKVRHKLVTEFENWYQEHYGHLLPTPSTTSASEDIQEKLDDGEMFEKLERERIGDDQTFAFFNAQRSRRKRK